MLPLVPAVVIVPPLLFALMFPFVFLIRPEVAVAVLVAIFIVFPIFPVPPVEHLPVVMFEHPSRQIATVNIAPRSAVVIAAVPAVIVELIISDFRLGSCFSPFSLQLTDFV